MLSNEIEWYDQYEVFTFVRHSFDVKKAKEIIRSKKARKVDIMVLAGVIDLVGNPPYRTEDGVLHMSAGIGINWDKLKSEDIDLSIPVIMIPFNDSYLPIDGWHRIAKAKIKEIKELPCVIMNKTETKQITL